MRIDSNAIAAEQCAIQVAIISAAIALVHGQQDEPALVCLDVFGGRVAHLVAAKERERKRERDSKLSRFSIFDLGGKCVEKCLIGNAQ